MKLRRIELTNIRRFAGRRASITEIGDGVSVLAAPNESGKSTVFESLQALLYQKFSAQTGAVKSLKPHSGGAPEVAVELEVEGKRYRIEKRWLSKPSAKVFDASGSLIAQADEAEAWIARLVGQDNKALPTGLIWVKQGEAGLESAGTIEARKAVMSPVELEVESMTGGRKMDRVLDKVKAKLDELRTSRGPKKGGPWAEAVERREALEAQVDELDQRLAALSDALAERQAAEIRRKELDDPEEEALRDQALKDAQAAKLQAEAHQQRVTAAEDALKLAQTHANIARERDQRAAHARNNLARAEEALTKARAEHANALAASEAATTQADAAQTTHQAAEARHRAATEARRASERHAAAQAAKARVAASEERLAKARAAAQTAREAKAESAAIALTPALLSKAEAAELALFKLRAQAEAQAVTLRFAYSGAAKARHKGQDIDEVLRISERETLELPGLGTLSIDPGLRPGDRLPEELRSAKTALQDALSACQAESIDAARALLQRKEALEFEAKNAEQLAKAHAPEGLEALEANLARDRSLIAPEADASPPLSIEAATEVENDAAEQAETCRRAASAALAAAATAREALARSEVALANAEAALREHKAALAESPAPEATAAALEEARAAEAAAQAKRDALANTAPNLALLTAQLERAQGAIRRVAEERQSLDRKIDTLNGAISVQADAGIEEEYGRLSGQLVEARRFEAALEQEAAVLARLHDALTAARRATQDAYFASVLTELRPLVELLHPEAEIQMEGKSLLPNRLVRQGVEEDLEILSGGTREQIAILTRLAFAKLLSKQGRDLPIILDDALTQTDDRRLDAMFNALHMAGQNQQVIVLTCRQRSFTALGGRALTIETETV